MNNLKLEHVATLSAHGYQILDPEGNLMKLNKHNGSVLFVRLSRRGFRAAEYDRFGRLTHTCLTCYARYYRGRSALMH